MKKFCLSAAILSAALVPASAMAGDTSVSVYTDLVSEYVFRGVSLGETSIQPGVDVSMGNFTVGAWFSTQVGETSQFSADEVDLYASYSFQPTENVSADVGVTYYHYPQGGSLFSTNDGASGTYEAFGSLGFDTTLSPSVSAYYDFTLKSLTGEVGIGHSVPLEGNWSIDLGAGAGYVFADGPGDYQWGQASASLGYAVSDTTSTYIGANFVVNSEDDTLNLKKVELAGETVGLAASSDSMLWFGIGIASGF